MKLPKISNSIRVLLVCFLISTVLTATIIIIIPPADPLDAYITPRSCRFIEFAGLSAAACDDGSTWLVSPFTP